MAIIDNIKSYYKLDGNSNDATATANNGTDTDVSYTLFENLQTGDSGDLGMYGSVMTDGLGQTFTPQTSHTITSWSWKMYRSGSGGSINVRIYACDGSHQPTGSVLASGTFDATGIVTSVGQFYNISLGAGVALTAGQEYICIAYPNGTITGGNAIHFIKDSTSYAGGRGTYYTSSWADAGYDFLFAEYGTGNSGKINQGAGFNGTTSKIEFSAVNGTTNMSLSVCFKTTQTPSGANPMIWGMTGSPALFRIAISNGTGHIAGFCQDSNSNITSAETTGNYNDGNWHLAVLTKSGNTVILDIDNGTERITGGAVTYTGNFNSMTPRMGTYNGVAEFYSGSADEAGYWEKTLSTTEISQLWNGGAGLAYPFTITNIKTINGLAKGSVKTVNGLAIASVKSINGLQ